MFKCFDNYAFMYLSFEENYLAVKDPINIYDVLVLSNALLSSINDGQIYSCVLTQKNYFVVKCSVCINHAIFILMLSKGLLASICGIQLCTYALRKSILLSKAPLASMVVLSSHLSWHQPSKNWFISCLYNTTIKITLFPLKVYEL